MFILTITHYYQSQQRLQSKVDAFLFCAWSKHLIYHKDIFGGSICIVLLLLPVRFHSMIVFFLYRCEFQHKLYNLNDTTFKTE